MEEAVKHSHPTETKGARNHLPFTSLNDEFARGTPKAGLMALKSEHQSVQFVGATQQTGGVDNCAAR